MNVRIGLRIATTTAAAALLAGVGAAQAAPLRMVCHELLRGEPVDPPIVYEVVGRDLVRTGLEGQRVVISTEGERHPLGVTHDRAGEMRSFAEHALRGEVLTRTLYWRRPGRPARRVSVERFDFAAGRYTDARGGPDRCNPRPMR